MFYDLPSFHFSEREIRLLVQVLQFKYKLFGVCVWTLLEERPTTPARFQISNGAFYSSKIDQEDVIC